MIDITKRIDVIPSAATVLPYAALAATLAVWQLGGIAGLAYLAGGSRVAKATTVDYPSPSHRS